MKKYQYFDKVFRRRNLIADLFLGFFLSFCSYPRLLLEVFIRKNFGERYFSLFAAGFITVVLSLTPMVLNSKDLLRFIKGYDKLYILEFLLFNWTWYVFIAAFVYMCIQRHHEIQRLPSVLDFKRFSLSTGEIHPRFLEFEINGKKQDIRTISTLIEPGLFFIIGGVLWLLQQPIGLVILISSIFYSFGYMGAQYAADNELMDLFDRTICDEELVSSLVEGKDPSQTRGVNYPGRRPADPEVRRRLADLLIENNDILEVL